MIFKKNILPLAILILLFLSCEKPTDKQSVENFDQHPTWTDNDSNRFWSKQHHPGVQIDTVWNGDTTIYF